MRCRPCPFRRRRKRIPSLSERFEGGAAIAQRPGLHRPDDTGPDDTGPDDTGPDDTGPDDTGPGCTRRTVHPRGAAICRPAGSQVQGRRRTVAPTQFIIEGVEGPEWWGISTVVSVMGVA